MELPDLNPVKAAGQAHDLLTVLQIWGMSRGHAKRIAEHMLRILADNSYQWKDLRDANNTETRNMLLRMAEQGKSELPS